VPCLANAYAIYLETSRAEAHRRIIERALGRGLSREEGIHRITARYFPAQDRYQAEHDPAGRADLLIDNEDFGRPRIVRGDVGAAPAALRLPLARLLGLGA
jgi:uridine kinase